MPRAPRTSRISPGRLFSSLPHPSHGSVSRIRTSAPTCSTVPDGTVSISPSTTTFARSTIASIRSRSSTARSTISTCRGLAPIALQSPSSPTPARAFISAARTISARGAGFR
jgi:hypothetical protein